MDRTPIKQHTADTRGPMLAMASEEENMSATEASHKDIKSVCCLARFVDLYLYLSAMLSNLPEN